MQETSAEWIENQNAVIRKQGYVIISIENEDGTTTTLSTLDKTNNLAQITHKRSYDPMGFELPVNNITFEVYNFDEDFFDYYKTYNGQALKVTVEYGYCLTQNETIPGGLFYMRDVACSETVITFTAVSGLELYSDVLVYQPSVDTDDTVIYDMTASTSLDSVAHESDIEQYNPIMTLTDIADVMPISVSLDQNTSALNICPVNGKSLSDLTLAMINISLSKCVIDRTDCVVISAKNNIPDLYVLNLNMMDKPTYTRTKAVSDIAVTAQTLSGEETEVCSEKTLGSAVTTKYDDISTYYSVRYAVDYDEYDISLVAAYPAKITRGIYEFRTSTSFYDGEVTLSRDIKIEEKKGVLVEYGTKYSSDHSKPDILIRKKITELETEKTINSYGEICDISNDLMLDPSEEYFQKIADYFSNRDTYDIYLRGDPARDAGDYVYLEIDNTYKKALVLSSELIFDGSFKENLTVRVIENDFEEFGSNLYSDLTAYTHGKLSAYTQSELKSISIGG